MKLLYKVLLALLAAALFPLAGCVAYDTPSAYGSGYDSRGYRDRDHDGIRDRNDRDRDGDGVRNRDDRAPDNPRRY